MSSGGRHERRNPPFNVDDAEGLLWTLAEQVGDCVKLLDLDGRVLRWNHACERLYGWRCEEVTGRVLPHVPEDMRLRTVADIRAIAAAGRVVERSAETVRADGTRIIIRLRIVPVLDSDGDGAGVISVSREVSADERLEWQQAELAAFIGRRLTEPLATIATSSQLLTRHEIGQDDVRRYAVASSVAQAAIEAAGVVGSLAVVSGLTRDKLTLTLEPLDMARLVTGVAKRFPGQRILVDFDPAAPSFLGDRRLIESAVEALVTIALTATPPSENVSVSVHHHKGKLLIEVCDRGPSPDEVELRRMMEPSYWMGGIRGGEGDGLAFALVAAVVRAHGALFSVGPVTPSGARFTIEFDVNRPRRSATLDG